MSTDARPGAPPLRLAPVVAVLALVAGALAMFAPLPGVGLALAALAATALRGRSLRRLAPAAVLATAVAAIIGPNLAVPGAPWLFAFRILIVGVGLAFTGYVLLGGTLPRVRGLRGPAALVALWVVWSALSIGWAEDRTAAARWTLFLAMMGGMAVAIGLTCRTPQAATRLLKVLGITFAVAVGVAMAELALGVRLPTSALLGRDRQVAFGATSLFGNQNNFATYLTLSLPYLVVAPVVFRDIRIRVVAVGGAIVALGALLYTGSKSNLLALAVILIAFLALLLTDRRRRGLLVGAVAVAGLAAAVVIPSVLGGGLVKLPDRAVQKFNFGLLSSQVQSDTGSGGVRNSLLRDGLDLVAESGGLGVGAGNAETRVRALANFPGVANLHNWWLEVLVNGGLVGFALWLGLYGLLLRGCLRAGRRAREPLVRYLGLAGALALLGYVFGALGPSTAIHFAPMWITLGLALVAVTVHRGTEPAAR